MKAKISVECDEEKLYALELELKKDRTTAAQLLGKPLDELYEKKVPEPVREFIDSKAAAKPKRPPRPASKPATTPGKQAEPKQEVRHEQ